MHKLQVQNCALPLLVPLGVTTARAVPGLTPRRLGVWALQKAAGGIRLRGGHGLVPSPDSESLMLRDQMAATAGGQNGSGVCVHLTCRLAGVTTLGGHQDASAVTALRGLSEPAPRLPVCPTPAHRGLGLAGRETPAFRHRMEHRLEGAGALGLGARTAARHLAPAPVSWVPKLSFSSTGWGRLGKRRGTRAGAVWCVCTSKSAVVEVTLTKVKCPEYGR